MIIHEYVKTRPSDQCIISSGGVFGRNATFHPSLCCSAVVRRCSNLLLLLNSPRWQLRHYLTLPPILHFIAFKPPPEEVYTEHENGQRQRHCPKEFEIDRYHDPVVVRVEVEELTSAYTLSLYQPRGKAREKHEDTRRWSLQVRRTSSLWLLLSSTGCRPSLSGCLVG